MNRLLRILLIGTLLAFLAYNLFHSTCPPANQIIAQWEKDHEEYKAGKISFDELIYRSDKLIKCSQKRRAAFVASRRCKRKTHTVPCQYHRHLHVTVGRGPVPRHAQVLTGNVRGLRAADVSRFGGEIAGDRPPRYVTRDVFRLDRTLAGNRPPRYEKSGVSARGLRSVRP